eukprot:TRINITY_DN5919_c0_g1_i1.p1 TRINITY_DN5919_c0_g1~~TRINITY_DN5919_c0_g1_i1.p1  ORF type:complete len:1318 (-),score=198.98 TRINITY_DN5919_c0_g1_i1:28-3981(-)
MASVADRAETKSHPVSPILTGSAIHHHNSPTPLSSPKTIITDKRRSRSPSIDAVQRRGFAFFSDKEKELRRIEREKEKEKSEKGDRAERNEKSEEGVTPIASSLSFRYINRRSSEPPKVKTTLPQRISNSDAMLRGNVFFRRGKEWKIYFLELEDISHFAELKDVNYPEAGRNHLISIIGCRISIQPQKSGVNFAIHDTNFKKTYEFRVTRMTDMNLWLTQIHNCQQFLLKREYYGPATLSESSSSSGDLGQHSRLGPNICPFLHSLGQKEEQIAPSDAQDIKKSIMGRVLSPCDPITDFLGILHRIELRHGSKIIQTAEGLEFAPTQRYGVDLLASLETSLNWQGQSQIQEHLSITSDNAEFSQKMVAYMKGLGSTSLLVKIVNACVPDTVTSFWNFISSNLLAHISTRDVANSYKVFIVFHADEIWVVHTKKLEEPVPEYPKYVATWEIKLVFDYNIDLIDWEGSLCSLQFSPFFLRSSRLNLQEILTPWARDEAFCPTVPSVEDIFKTTTDGIKDVAMHEKEVFTGTPQEVLFRSVNASNTPLGSYPSSPFCSSGILPIYPFPSISSCSSMQSWESSGSPSFDHADRFSPSPPESPISTPPMARAARKERRKGIAVRSYSEALLAMESSTSSNKLSLSNPGSPSSKFISEEEILRSASADSFSPTERVPPRIAAILNWNLTSDSDTESKNSDVETPRCPMDADPGYNSGTASPKFLDKIHFAECIRMSSVFTNPRKLSEQPSGDLFRSGLKVPPGQLLLNKIDMFNKKGQRVDLAELVGYRLTVVVVLRNFACLYPSIQSQEMLAETELELMGLGANLIIIGRGSKETYNQWLSACSQKESRSLDDVTYWTTMSFDEVMQKFGTPKKKSHSMSTLFAQAVFEPDNGLLYYYRPHEALLDLNFFKICRTLEEFGRTHDLEVWREIVSNSPSSTRTPRIRIITNSEKPAEIGARTTNFWQENPKNILHDDVKVKKGKALVIEGSYEHYSGFYDKDKPAVISISSEASLNGTRQAVLWLSHTVKKIIVPRENAGTISDSLKHSAHVARLSYNAHITSCDFTQRENIVEDLNELSLRLHENSFKFGVVSRQKGQSTAKELYKNNYMSPSFHEFLDIMGEKIPLRGWKGFTGGLDTDHDSHGRHSYYTDFHSERVMFHVATMIPMVPGDPSRKRHVGNDIVVIIFKDEECTEPLDLKSFGSQFNHIFVEVTKLRDQDLDKFKNAITGDVNSEWYHIQVFCKEGLLEFHPRLPNPPLVKKENLREWLLTKCINGERSAVEEVIAFSKRILATRQKMLEEILSKHAIATAKTKKRKVTVNF